MKIMNEYTYEHLKKNKRYTISILAAVIIASSLLCSLSIFVYSVWNTKLNTVIDKTGYWQGEIGESIYGDKLKTVVDNPNIEETMIKGSWVTAKLTDSKRPYLLMRDANKEFWKNMNFKDAVLEGRLPEKPKEIVISKLFFNDNPQYKVGDRLTIPIGKRMLNGEEILTQSIRRDGEYFYEVGTETYTIVGELDISGVSAFPGYIAMGYMNISSIKDDDELTVYVNLKNPRKIYSELPKLAESIGVGKDDHGDYKINYNNQMLNLYGISNTNSSNTQLILIIVAAVIMILLIITAFVLIIYNSFSLSANSRIKELSILKSLGATPKEIKRSVLYEGFLLWLFQLPVGLIIGYGFSYYVFSKVNGILSLTEDYKDMQVCCSWWVIAISIIMSLITVLVSAYIPARKVSRVSAISGIRQSSEETNIKKKKNHRIINKLFGIEGELAAAQFSANKKSLRTAVLSLALCFTLISGYISVMAIYNLADSENDVEIMHDVSVDITIDDKPSEEMIEKIISLPEVKDNVIKRQAATSTYLDESQESPEFSELGGFSEVDTNKFNVLEEDGKYKVIINVVGLSDESFKNYCKDIGADYTKYYRSKDILGVLINSTYCISNESNKPEKIPFLNIKEGEKMHLYEKISDDMKTDNNFDIKLGDITDKYPTDLSNGRYSVSLVIPMEKYEDIVSSFEDNRILEFNSMSINLDVGEEKSLEVKKELIDICDSYLGTEDYSIWTLLEEKNHNELVQKAIKIGISSVAIMIGIIGLFNAFSIISNNMRLRRKEFGMLRSIGLTPKGLNKMLTLEGLLFALKPIVVSIPIILLICIFMLRLTPAVTFAGFISAFPYGAIILYSILIFAAIILSYLISSRTVKKSNIIESMKDDMI